MSIQGMLIAANGYLNFGRLAEKTLSISKAYSEILSDLESCLSDPCTTAEQSRQCLQNVKAAAEKIVQGMPHSTWVRQAMKVEEDAHLKEFSPSWFRVPAA